jgi:5-methylcytosine-specific restriction protein A
MSESRIAIARRAVNAALAELRMASISAGGQDLIDNLTFLQAVVRQAEHDVLHAVARLDSEGEFTERGMRPTPAVADLLRCTPAQSRRIVALAGSIFPTSLRGEALEPRLPATATALGGWEIGRAHGEVIERALGSDAAGRLSPEVWAGVEVQLADWARLYRPDELARLAAVVIEQLDQDGPPPHDEDQLVNELHLTRSHTGGGGRIKGRLDATTFDALARAIHAALTPVEPDDLDRDKTLGERQADALAAICEHALDDGYLPAEGGQRPHFTAILNFETLRTQARGAELEFGGMTTAAQLRRLTCDAKITPVVLGGDGQPLDVGREKRCVTPAQRKAIAARDGGCAYPGCDKTPRWCEVHHIVITLCTGYTAAEPTSITSSCSASPITTNSTTPAGKPTYATDSRNSFRPNGTTHTRDHEETPGQALWWASLFRAARHCSNRRLPAADAGFTHPSTPPPQRQLPLQEGARQTNPRP